MFKKFDPQSQSTDSNRIGIDIDTKETVFDDVCKTIEQNFFSPNYNGLDWLKEKKSYRDKITAAHSYSEMTYLVRELLDKFKVSHVGFSPIFPDSDEKTETPKEKNVEWKKINEKTGYIKIKEFSDESGQSGKLIEQAFSELSNLPSLIIDLRDNPGGGIEVAEPLGKHLFREKQCVGYFYDNKGAAKLKTDSLGELQKQTAKKQANIYKMEISGTGDKAYKGKVVILINEESYSTTEALAAAFKESGRGILIGKKTGGQMLARNDFPIDNHWLLVIPVQDFRTCQGVKVEGVGVSPDIEVEEKNSEDAILAKAIELLNK